MMKQKRFVLTYSIIMIPNNDVSYPRNIRRGKVPITSVSLHAPMSLIELVDKL